MTREREFRHGPFRVTISGFWPRYGWEIYNSAYGWAGGVRWTRKRTKRAVYLAVADFVGDSP